MESLKQNIVNRIIPILDKAGMYYRIFARVKTKESIKKKLDLKGNEYRQKGKKMQDIIGIRIVFYFQEDVGIFYERLKNEDGYDRNCESNSLKDLKEYSDIISSWDDEPSDNKTKLKRLLPFHDKVFMPERLNIVMKMNSQEKDYLNSSLQYYVNDVDLIDSTYEVQLRTVFSEGWHEIEHDLRYKTKDEGWWNYCGEESRMLNGIYASLETNEKALSQMIQEITYKNYKNKSWDAMIRFHFRIRMNEEKLPKELCEILDKDERTAKDILHITKKELSTWLWELSNRIPLSTQLILFLINRKRLSNSNISNSESASIKMILDNISPKTVSIPK